MVAFLSIVTLLSPQIGSRSASKYFRTRPVFVSILSRSALVGMRRPAFDQVGRPAAGAFFSRTGLPPVALTMCTRQAEPTGRTNAIFLPFGDHAGYASRAPFVRRFSLLPSAFIVKM